MHNPPVYNAPQQRMKTHAQAVDFSNFGDMRVGFGFNDANPQRMFQCAHLFSCLGTAKIISEAAHA